MKTCQRCGANNNDENNFCENCATPFNQSQPYYQQNIPVKNKKPIYSKWWFWIIIIIVVSGFASRTGINKDKAVNSYPNVSVSTYTAPSVKPSPSVEPSAESSVDTSNQIGSGTIDDYFVSIKEFKVIEKYDGDPAVIITYEWTNNSDDEASFSFSFDDKVYQNGIECEFAIIIDNDAYDGSNSIKDIKPGSTLEVQEVYSLNDATTPIDIEVTELITFDKTPSTVKQTFKIA